jgi:3-mercaptopyruvate sulfurtransferase SseA
VARALMDRGFSKVRPLEGGLEAWIAAGLPVEEETTTFYQGTGPLPTVR